MKIKDFLEANKKIEDPSIRVHNLLIAYARLMELIDLGERADRLSKIKTHYHKRRR